MDIVRLWRHLTALPWRTALRFPPSSLAAIEAAIGAAERSHQGQIRFVIETALPPGNILHGQAPRARALELFAQLGVWDTEYNNGVLLYVLMADRQAEIVADRGFRGRIEPREWEAVCRLMEQHFRAGDYARGALAGIESVAGLLARHFPVRPVPRAAPGNELTDQPTLL